METVVILFLMGTGSFCILMQALLTFTNSRPLTAAKAAKVVAKAGADKPSSAKTAKDDDPSARERVLGVIGDVLGTKAPADGKLGLLGFALLAVGVLLVIDFTVSVSFSTV